MQATREERIDVGYRVGKLTVRERTKERKNGYMVWRCACDCGGEILLDTRHLQRGIVTDCGCGGRVSTRKYDLTGERFGSLICLGATGEHGKGGTIWRCRCDCGRECLVPTRQLTGGYKKSCGCLRGPRPELYLGQRFGALVVTGYAGKADGKHMWRCRCDCGRETEVAQSNLKTGHTRSCGCRQRETCRENLKLVDGTSVVMIEHRMKQPIRTNTSGISGVYYDHRRGMWCAQITFKGKTYYLGSYKDVEEAAKARRKGEEMYDDFLEWYYNRTAEKTRS